MSSSYSGNSNKSESSPVNDSGVPIQQIIQAGEAAAALLENPVYNIAHQMAVTEAIDLWSRTQPKEHQKREGLWHEVQALGRVAETLAGMVARARELATKQAEEQKGAEQDYLNRQGFGLDENYGNTFQ